MIKTERLELIPLSTIYSKDLYNIWSNEEILKYTHATKVNNKFECDARTNLWVKEYTDKENPNNFVVLLNKKVIGIIGYPIISKEERKFGLYYQFLKEYWGQGYATEATKAVIDNIKDIYKEAIVYADAVIENKASNKILKKFLFEEVSIEREGFTKDNTKLDIIHYRKKLK